MNERTKKALIVVGASLTVVVVGWAVLIGSVLAWSGVAMVSVVEKGRSELTIPIPMAVVEAAAATSGVVLNGSRHLDVEIDLGEWEPAINEILAVIDDCPDVVLVEVEDGSDLVRVEKEGGSLLIRVTDGDVDLEVSVPTRSVRRTVSLLLS